MPVVKVIRKGVTPSLRPVPTSTCATIMPMTLSQMGKEVTRDDEEPTKVTSLQEAFEEFQPSIKFEGTAGEQETAFRAEFRPRSLKDFHPDNLLKRQEIKNMKGETEYLPNDLAGLKNNIDLLYRLKKRWAIPAVRRAWDDPNRRREIVEALGRLRSELERVAGPGGNQ